jgi:hypothetical protein
MELTFQPATATEPRCGDVQITNEDILEDDESFSVVLGSSDNAVVVDSSTATVTIRNDDSKFTKYCLTNRNYFYFGYFLFRCDCQTCSSRV